MFVQFRRQVNYSVQHYILLFQPMNTEMTFRYLALENENSSPWKSTSFETGGHTSSRRRHTGVGVITGVPECRLDVEIGQIVFDYHPLYTWEHVHAQNLRQVVTAYRTEMSRDQVNACIERVSVFCKYGSGLTNLCIKNLPAIRPIYIVFFSLLR